MSSFGEINEPSSRTAWEDWDDGLYSENLTELRFDREMEVPRDINTFIILEGRYIYDSIRTQHNLELINTIADVNLRLYKTKKLGNYVCVIRNYSLVLSSEIVELLKKYINISTNVVAMLTKPLVEYQVAELVTKDYILRSLCTSKQLSKPINIVFPNLEQPNIISGISAGVLCWRETMDQPAIAVVCYIEHPEEQQIKELYDLLEKLDVIPHVENIHRTNLMNSNLYI
ncbi:uncharacterized protein LOC113498302 [Trichoplusia ni]|uniref:Proteasome assembly chaperone 1 n=1 Tax=Trichoplusia ni TaxID=7111 RepID=A0A7E5W1A8_TRINI|nr:uncharacterized protein LOC113498301 [Trichoplusia ni]XP_026734071.1 uncharacterized protein LOC113498302 [Trichoplusia ni]